MHVVIADVEEAPLAATADELGVVGVRTDVSDADIACRRSPTRYVERFGAVHVLCNNAGVGGGGLIADLTLADWQWVLGVNLWGVVHGLHSFLPHAAGEPRRRPHREHGVGRRAGRRAGHRAVQREQVRGRRDQRDARKRARAAEGRTSVCRCCAPGYVRTNIFESQRNRPESLRKPSRGRPRDAARAERALKQVLEIAMDPAEVAAMVHDAIVEDRFWIIPHPEFLKAVSERADDIVAGKTLGRADSANDAGSTTAPTRSDLMLRKPIALLFAVGSCSLSPPAAVTTAAASRAGHDLRAAPAPRRPAASSGTGDSG